MSSLAACPRRHLGDLARKSCPHFFYLKRATPSLKPGKKQLVRDDGARINQVVRAWLSSASRSRIVGTNVAPVAVCANPQVFWRPDSRIESASYPVRSNGGPLTAFRRRKIAGGKEYVWNEPFFQPSLFPKTLRVSIFDKADESKYIAHWDDFSDMSPMQPPICEKGRPKFLACGLIRLLGLQNVVLSTVLMFEGAPWRVFAWIVRPGCIAKRSAFCHCVHR